MLMTAAAADIPDFCVTLGGDGTVLHTASLFRQEAALPPVTAFAMGTLGFLTPFEASNFEPLLSRHDSHQTYGFCVELSHYSRLVIIKRLERCCLLWHAAQHLDIVLVNESAWRAIDSHSRSRIQL